MVSLGCLWLKLSRHLKTCKDLNCHVQEGEYETKCHDKRSYDEFGVPVVKTVTPSEDMYRLVLKNCHMQEGEYATKCHGITK